MAFVPFVVVDPACVIKTISYVIETVTREHVDDKFAEF